MNSAVKRLFILFFSFAAFTACEDPKDIGLELQDENLIGTVFTDTLTINTGTVLLPDSILSFRAANTLVGQYVDPYLGQVRASSFLEVGLNGANLNFGNNITADSLVLTLDYGFKYADTLKTMQVNAHRLTGTFDDRTSYFTNTAMAYDPTPIGTAQFQPRIVVIDNEGTKTKQTRLLRIKLNSELANSFAAQSGQPTFANQANFLNFFGGLALTVPQDENGSIVSFTLGSTTTSLVLYYKADGTAKQHAFTVGRENFFSQIRSDRTGTSLEGLQAKGNFVPATDATGNRSFVQAGTQLLTKITFPYLNRLKEQNQNLMINRAELLIPIEAGVTEGNKPLPQQLVLYETNANNQLLRDASGAFRAVQQDGINPLLTAYPANLTLNSKNGKQYYSLNITSYLQGYIMDLKANNGLLLGAAQVAGESNGTRSIQPEIRPFRAVILNTDENPVKLLIYYSKLQ